MRTCRFALACDSQFGPEMAVFDIVVGVFRVERSDAKPID
jgi:hypothetical protein